MHALRGVSLTLDPATIHAVVGPSGCGKSTLLYILGLLDQLDGGWVTIKSELISHLRDNVLARKRNELIGFIFQFHFLMEDFTAQENVMIRCADLGVSRKMKCEIARQNCSMPSTLEISFHVPAVIFPAANSNAWRSRAPWRTIHALSSPMNLPGISIPRTRCAPSSFRKKW